MKIGVFDSGIGGLSVANAIKQALPEHQIIFKDDAKHLPYGTKPMDEVLAYVLPVLESLVEDGCACIVIACNTVSTNLIETLRAIFEVPLIGMEPMVRPAAKQSKTGTIAVCATPATLSSRRYAWLKQEYAPNTTVLEPDCADWAAMIEGNKMDRQKLSDQIGQVLAQDADVVVLGCTHYHWIEADIKRIAKGRAAVLQPEQPVIEQLKQVLKLLA